MSYHVSVDIGGTFTDLFLRDENGKTSAVKTPTTHDELTQGVLNALDKTAEAEGLKRADLLAKTEQLVHGTTIATNAIIEDTMDKTALLCTDGFRDTLLFRKGGRDEAFQVHTDYPDPYIPRSQTYGIDERINAEGDVETDLDEEEAIAAIERARERNCDAIAVAFLWAHMNPKHERRVGTLIEQYAPELEYSLSHEVNPVIREYRRTSATAIDASLKGPIASYLTQLRSWLEESGFQEEPLLITSNGGVMEFSDVTSRPIWSVDSGPTMLPSAGLKVCRTESETDTPNVVTLDMGGTSLDIGLVRGGSISRTRDAEVADSVLGIEKVDVRSIGSGGGSIARVDNGGLLHVGPASAGSDPGPACYGQGGERPTITDAALVLGYLSPDRRLGGEVSIDRDAARTAVETHIGSPLDVSAVEAAHAIYATANQNMVSGIREVTIERGIDPRNYVICGGGGALGMHAVALAQELNVGQVILPREAGVISAFGGTHSDLRRDFSATQRTDSESFDIATVNDTLSALREQAEQFLDGVGVETAAQDMTYYTEARYTQQAWEIEVEAPLPPLDRSDVTALLNEFNRVHDARYGYEMSDQGIEFIHWRVEASAETGTSNTERIVSSANDDVDAGKHSTAEAYFDGKWVPTPRYDGAALGPNHEIDGPAIVDAHNTTVIVPPETDLTVSQHGNYIIETNVE